MLNNLQILKHPNDILRKRAKELNMKEFNQELVSKLLSMHTIMVEQNGIGLAANQVGFLDRIIVVDIRQDQKKDWEHDLGSEVFFMINPEIIHCSSKKTILEEGCLSVEEKLIKVSRPDGIVCCYFDLYGKQKTVKARGLLAKVIQHEIDHLDGKLIVDYLDIANNIA